MSYIGNARTPLLLASNVRDDLIPDGIKTVFELSQEVPGGEEINVCVVRRRWLTDTLVENTTLVQFSQLNTTQSQITINDNFLAAAFSIVQPRSQSGAEDGDYISLTFASGEQTQNFKVDSISYTRDSINITLDGIVEQEKYVSFGTTISNIRRSYYGPWEILDPETQYEIISTAGFTNRKIQIKDLIPHSSDILYVLHRGEGTYNFVPSPYSVGPEQLSLNLRSFVTDSQDYTTTGEKTILLSQTTPTASTLLVTVNGVVQISTDEIKLKNPTIPDESNTGTWTLNPIEGTSQTITLKESLFTNASLSSPVSVRVLHLTFSTVARRAAFSPIQEPKFIEPGSVTNISLAQNSVSTEKLQDNSVTGSKILIPKNQAVRFQTSPSTESSVITLNQVSNNTQINSTGSVEIRPQNRTYILNSTHILPDVTDVVSLGSSTQKFKDLNLSGAANVSTINVNEIEVSGNIKITGTIDNTDVSDLKNDVNDLQNKVDDIVKFLIPIGTIVPSARLTPPISTTYGTWMVCDGRTLSRQQYSELFNALGGASLQSSWPWGVCTDQVFSIPDLRRRAPIGQSTNDSLGSSEGQSQVTLRTFTHTHSGAEHKHTMSHAHTIPGHKHTVNSSATGSISISTDSGSHNTNISHSHSSDPAMRTNSEAVNHRHQLTHSHSGTTAGVKEVSPGVPGGRHTHGGTTGAGTEHRHEMDWSEVSAASSSTRNIRQPGGSSRNSSWFSMEKSHTHSFTTDGADIPHQHDFSIASQTDNTGNAIRTDNNDSFDLSHSHSFSIPSTTVNSGNTTDKLMSTSTGAHQHASSSFSGFIGTSTNAPEGNNNLSTNSQDITDTSTVTGSAAGTTGSSTLPHIIVNYMIRVA